MNENMEKKWWLPTPTLEAEVIRNFAYDIASR